MHHASNNARSPATKSLKSLQMAALRGYPHIRQFLAVVTQNAQPSAHDPAPRAPLMVLMAFLSPPCARALSRAKD